LQRAFIVLLCLSMMIGCERSKVDILQRRLDNFREILPPEVRQEFDSKNYETVTRGIDSLLLDDPTFKEEYQRLKHEELIDVFSTAEVVEFFEEHFVEEIERLNQKRGSS
jgi:hypothetical protein